jgi:phospholipid transport system substrate-binding protein
MMKFVTLIYILSLFFIPANYCSASDVQDQLEISINRILDILKDPTLKGEDKTEQRREILREAIYERFNFTLMSRLSLGKNWRERTEEEKEVFTELFGKLLEQSYASKIESYTDEKVEFLKERISGNKAQINTMLVGNTTKIFIDYRLYEEDDGQWRIFDIIVEGVSLINNYRSQFSEIIQKENFEKLIEKLKDMTKN